MAIDRYLLELVLSTDGRLCSGVSQSRCKSVYGTESHTPVNTPKRREHNLIYAAVNLTRARVQLIIEYCARRFVLLKLSTDRHEASRGLFATAEILVPLVCKLD